MTDLKAATVPNGLPDCAPKMQKPGWGAGLILTADGPAAKAVKEKQKKRRRAVIFI
jgi:hypothetical protein